MSQRFYGPKARARQEKARAKEKARYLDALALLEEYAGNFVTHWMEDDGNDAEDKAHCEKTADNITNAAQLLRVLLEGRA